MLRQHMHRVGVLPFKLKNNDIVMLVVSSQTRSRWILPKGRLKKGESHEDGCHREAFEEAGIKGIVFSDYPITLPVTRKTDEGMEKIPVTYYPMFVEDTSDKWPERRDRERKWVRMKEAKNVIPGRDMLDVVKRFDKLLPWIKQAVEQAQATDKKERKLKLVK